MPAVRFLILNEATLLLMTVVYSTPPSINFIVPLALVYTSIVKSPYTIASLHLISS